jgi:hypothetical protein
MLKSTPPVQKTLDSVSLTDTKIGKNETKSNKEASHSEYCDWIDYLRGIDTENE